MIKIYTPSAPKTHVHSTGLQYSILECPGKEVRISGDRINGLQPGYTWGISGL